MPMEQNLMIRVLYPTILVMFLPVQVTTKSLVEEVTIGFMVDLGTIQLMVGEELIPLIILMMEMTQQERQLIV